MGSCPSGFQVDATPALGAARAQFAFLLIVLTLYAYQPADRLFCFGSFWPSGFDVLDRLPRKAARHFAQRRHSTSDLYRCLLSNPQTKQAAPDPLPAGVLAAVALLQLRPVENLWCVLIIAGHEYTERVAIPPSVMQPYVTVPIGISPFSPQANSFDRAW